MICSTVVRELTGRYSRVPRLTYLDTLAGWTILSSEGNDFLQNVEIAVESGGQRNLLVGSTGFATIQAAFVAAASGDNVRLAVGDLYRLGDLQRYRADGDCAGRGGEERHYAGEPFGITVYASSGADTITGSGNGASSRRRRRGHPSGGNGNDLLNGGAGTDTLAGDGGNDIYFVDNVGDVVVEGGQCRRPGLCSSSTMCSAGSRGRGSGGHRSCARRRSI